MRTDRDQRTDKEQEIDDFLAQFDAPLDDFSTDVNSYLGDTDSTKYTTLSTFYGKTFSNPENKVDYSSVSGYQHTSRAERSGESTKSSTVNEVTQAVTTAKFDGNSSTPDNNFDGKKPNSERAEKREAEKREKAIHKAKLKKFDEGKSLKQKIKEFIFGAKFPDGTWAREPLKQRLFLVENPYYNPNLPEDTVFEIDGKKIKNKPYFVSGKKILRDIIYCGVAMVICVMLYAFVLISLAPKVDASDIYATVEQSSIIYDDEGNAVDTVYYTQNRKLIKYEDCPEDLINAFVAIEDKTFWKHHGFNWTRMIGAILNSFTGGNISGTSTITQQLARNVYLADTKSVRSIKRKILEMYYASQIEMCLSKEEIIEAYMNTIYLGFGNYGVSSAAKTYFSKDVKDLTLVECAAIAALPQAPESYALVKYADAETISEDSTNIILREPDTYVCNDISKDRRDLTLELMNEQGYITDKQLEENKGTDLITFIHPTIQSASTNTYSYFHEYLVDAVIEDLMDKYDYSYSDAENLVYTGGLRIYSTVDSTAQTTIVNEFNDPDNFPGVNYSTGDNDNIYEDGELKSYAMSTYFDASGNFIFGNTECTINENGSVTIKRGMRVNIYKTENNGVVDYSVEFKSMYTEEDDTLYTIAGGYISIPAEYKKLDKNNDLVISKKFFENNNGTIRIEGDTLVVTPEAYSLQQKTIQPQAAMVIVGVGTGQIKAMVGGRMTSGERLLNRATNTRQPGSSIKPLAVYGAALQKSYELEKEGKKWDYIKVGNDKQQTVGYGSYLTASSVIVDEPLYFNGKRWPYNDNGQTTGKQTLRTAMQQSLNTCAVKIQMQVGVEFSMNLLEKYGLTTLVTEEDNAEANDENTAAMALGGMTYGVKPIEMALAYASIPNGGVRNSAVCYTKVTDKNGKTLLTSKSKTNKVLNEGVAWILNDMLQSVVKVYATGAWVNNVQSGGKTGTTEANWDIWFDGFTPTYAASLWIGTDNNVSLTTMSAPAHRLWGKIMRQLPKAQTGSYKSMPSNVISDGGEYYTKGTNVGKEEYKTDEEKAAEEEAKKQAEEAAKIQKTIENIDNKVKNGGYTLEEACKLEGWTVDEYHENGGTLQEEEEED